jgi:hypothetical protein
MKVSKALMSISNYPIPMPVIENIMDTEGLDAEEDETSVEMRQSDAFKKCTAAVYLFLADAPNVTQGGISYSFSEEERKRFAKMAAGIKAELGDQNDAEIEVGYFGEDF